MLTDLNTYKSFEGRIGRQTWWLSQILMSIALMIPYAIAMGIMFATMDTSGPEPQPSGLGLALGGLILLIVFVVAIWASLAINVKRWHDRGKSGWWVLLSFVPLANIWAFIETGFLRGTEGPNEFGPDPIAE